jgi:two-component system response regulator YesN
VKAATNLPLRVLVVDDEELIRQNIVHLLGGLEMRVDVCGQAENGEQALALVETLAPDIVLLDISMPVLDGRKVMQALKSRGSASKVVVLSGYSEFEYAVEALRFGAVNYLLKPLDPEVMGKLFHDLAAQVLLARIASPSGLRSPNWFEGILSTEEARAEAEGLDYLKDFGSSHFVVLLVHLGEPFTEADEQKVAQATSELKARFWAQTHQWSGDRVLFALGEPPELECVATKTQESLQAASRLVTIGVSAIQAAGSPIRGAVAQACEASKGRLVDQPGRIYRSTGELPVDDLKVRLIVETSLETIRAQLQEFELHPSSSLATLTGLLEGLFNRDLVASLSWEATRQLFRRIQSAIDDLPHSAKVPPPLSRVTLDQFESLQAICDYFQVRLRTVFSTVVPLPVDGRHLAFEAQRILDTGFRKDLSLTAVAQSIGLAPNYLSELFKEVLGVNFVEYLGRVRTQEAKRLLIHTKLSIKDISTLVGYSSVEYFYKVFKAREGHTPNAYRKLRGSSEESTDTGRNK